MKPLVSPPNKKRAASKLARLLPAYLKFIILLCIVGNTAQKFHSSS